MKKRRTKFRTAALGFAAIATSLLIGMTSACASNKDEDDKEEETTKTEIDEQEIQNGNFEFYDDNDGIYPISTPDNWSGGTKGNSSDSKSGIIDTAKDRWDYITAADFGKKLEDNEDLDSDDENKLDYNGVTKDDLLYRDPHKALTTNPSDTDLTMINNPLTHKYAYDAEGNMTNQTYKDKDGNLFLDEALTDPVETSVLMLHNFRKNYYTGTESYFKSATTLTLEANTACEISLWVKTSNLTFDGTDASRTPVVSERGAYIQVDTEVGGNALDKFLIKNIDTETLNNKSDSYENNGWIQYTVFVEASSFADTTVTLTLGLGEDDIYTVEGYAFFDDVQFKKYSNVNELKKATANFDDLTKDTMYCPLAAETTSEFRVDSESVKTNDESGDITTVSKPHYSANRHFFIDFAKTTAEGTSVALKNNANLKAGYTVEETTTGKYVCSQNTIGKLDLTQLDGNIDAAHFIPNGIKNKINVTSDIITAFDGINSEDWTCGLGTEYDAVINNALKSASALPGATGQAMLMLSARGAAYEAQLTDDSFSLENGQNALITFWLKTSDMSGKTAATVTAVAENDKTNSSQFTLDTTTVAAVEIDGKEVYDGWVRCFVRVSNTSEEEGAKSFKIKINLGTTSIKGSSVSDYNSGWLAVANMSVMRDLDEDVFGYSSGVSNCATLEFKEKAVNNSYVFDSELGDKNVIETALAAPSSYTGVNGASTYVSPSYKPVTEDDESNNNEYAGLMNKENFANYADCGFYGALKTITGQTDSAKLWQAVAGEYTVQPLIIVNNVNEGKYNNYGYIAKSAVSVAENGYTAISVKVKASTGAVANIYLVEANDKTNSVASYSIPEYSFWYDDDGNILKGEPDEDAPRAEKKANIAYTLRSDGLYEKDGVLYANFYNLSKFYDRKYEHVNDFWLDGKKVAFEDLKTGVDYFNSDASAYAPHYLVASQKGNNKVYEYKEGLGKDAVYYYMEKGVANTSKLVHAIDTEYAKPRYTASDAVPYQFTIDTNKNPEYADKWLTVTFNVHAGSEAKNFKLELWSGDRANKTTDATAASYVLFDYSGASLDATSYSSNLSAYTDQITADYRDILDRNGISLEDNDGSIDDLEALAGADKRSALFRYIASYYAFSLYDSSAFIPFNAETADDPKAGYSYSYSDYQKSLAFLKVEDDENAMLSAFIDYSVIDKDIEIIGAPTVETDDDHTHTDTEGSSSNVWLLAASIALVVAIFITIVALLIKDFLKKHKKKKTSGKNSYNFNKNKRYVKKYVKANGEAPETQEADVDESLLSDKPEKDENADGDTDEAENTAEELPEEKNEEAKPKEDSEDKESSAGDPAEPDKD